MSNLETNFGHACVEKKSITYENNHSCKHRLVIVLRIQNSYSYKTWFPLHGKCHDHCKKKKQSDYKVEQSSSTLIALF